MARSHNPSPPRQRLWHRLYLHRLRRLRPRLPKGPRPAAPRRRNRFRRFHRRLLPPPPEPRAVESPGPRSDSPGEPPPYTKPTTPPASAVSFGRQGQWAILATSTYAGISSETFSGSAASFFNANAAIGIDTFVAPNFSIGIDAEVSYGDNKGYGATSLYETASTHLSGGVRFGLNVPMGHLLSWYPRLTIGIQSDHSDTQTISVFNANAIPAPASSISSVGPWTNLFAPFLVHLAPAAGGSMAEAPVRRSRRDRFHRCDDGSDQFFQLLQLERIQSQRQSLPWVRLFRSRWLVDRSECIR
jgi:hypothetical protein